MMVMVMVPALDAYLTGVAHESRRRIQRVRVFGGVEANVLAADHLAEQVLVRVCVQGRHRSRRPEPDVRPHAFVVRTNAHQVCQ